MAVQAVDFDRMNDGDDDTLFMEALEMAVRLPPESRRSRLSEAYSGHTALVQEVMERAAWREVMGDFLLEPLIPFESTDARFAAGELVAGRFLIVREVAEGGMGVVYEAVDTKLDQRCALKCAKPGFAFRLLPEARSALRITHPNVCRVYGIYTAETSRGPVDVLAMEYLDGETISERLARTGPLEPAEAVEVARQLCAGLNTAHREGVLHRDLKSNNILLTRAPDGGVRAVITDFGVAKQHLGDVDASGTGRSDLVGAKSYIAPELWRGGRASAASDIYALGVVFYEMVTGCLPAAANGSAPTVPSILVAGLDQRWDRCLRRCLAEDPADRPTDVTAIAAVLNGRGTKRRVWAAVLSATIAAVAVFTASELPSAPSARLALLPFDTPNDEQVTELTNGVLHDLSDRVRRLGRDGSLLVIPLGEALANRVTAAEQARRTLGATHVLSGRVDRVNGHIRLHASVVDARTLVTVRALSAEYALDEVRDMPLALAGTITAALHLNGERLDEASISRAAYPAFAQGMSHLRAGTSDPELAIDRFEEAARLDARSALPHAALTEAFTSKYQHSGDRAWLQRATQSLVKAESRNPDLALVRIASGRVHLAFGQHEMAVGDFNRAIQLEPDNVIAWLGLGRAYDAQRTRPSDAAAAFQRAVDLQPDYYLPHLQFASFYHFLGNYQRAEQHLKRAIEIAPDLVIPYTNLGGLYADMGRYQEAERMLRRSLALKESAGALTNLGAVLNYQGRDRDALAAYRKALLLRRPDFVLMVNVGDTYGRLGLATEAADAYRQGLALADRDVLNDPHNGYSRAFVAYFAARLGQYDRARREIDQARRFSPFDGKVIRRAALTYETLRQRRDTLAVLHDAPQAVLQELSRQPDLSDLQRDSAFQQLVRVTAK